MTGYDPATSRLTIECSSQLSYTRVRLERHDLNVELSLLESDTLPVELRPKKGAWQDSNPPDD